MHKAGPTFHNMTHVSEQGPNSFPKQSMENRFEQCPKASFHWGGVTPLHTHSRGETLQFNARGLSGPGSQPAPPPNGIPPLTIVVFGRWICLRAPEETHANHTEEG